MGTVHKLATGRETITLGEAVTTYLTTLDRPESRRTQRAYGTAYRAMLDALGAGRGIGEITGAELAAWFTGRWGDATPATWDARRGALRSLLGFCEREGWIPSAAEAARGIGHRRRPPDRTRALSRAEVERLLTRDGIGLRERTFWRLLYESAARAGEVLALDAGDLDLPNRRAKVTRKGGAADVITWRTGTARLLPRLLKGRRTGPVFLTERKARLPLPPGDIDPASGRARLSYQQAGALFKAASGGATLHQLRHSALTHAAEDGASTATLLAYSGHTSVTSLARYARVSPEALGRWQAERDPARRR